MAQTMPNFPVTQNTVPSTKVEISVSCRKLMNKDVTSKSDPICVLYICEFGSTKFLEFGRTEEIKDTLNPDFVKKFIVEYRFEEQQKLKFLVIDSDSKSGDVRKHDLLGEYECSLGELVSLGSTTNPLKCKGSTHNCGTITVRTEEVLACNDVLMVKLCGVKLDKKDTFGKSDPFLVFYKCNEDQSFTAVHKSEVIKNTLNPSWREMRIPVGALCNGDVNRSLKVECYDWDSDGSHDLIGVFVTNVLELSTPNSSFELKNPKKASKKKYINSGVIKVEHAKMVKNYGFLDYIQAGVQMNFTVAIDFTQSNGNPSDPRSLHYIDNVGLNQYATALMSVGNIIQDYDSDKMFPALGFGGKLPDGTVSHEFFLNLNPGNPFCAGIGGVMHAYQSAIRSVALWGPTNFAPVINHVAKFAAAMRDGTNYFVLLIITDGVITDMPQTVQAIIEASFLPMSIIIVGVGGADFSDKKNSDMKKDNWENDDDVTNHYLLAGDNCSELENDDLKDENETGHQYFAAMESLDDVLGGSDSMHVLDADNHALTARGRTAQRDIVQFVPLRDYLSSGDSSMVQARLAKAVLAEVPEQFLGYMRRHNIGPPKQRLVPQSISSGPAMPQPSAPPM